MILILEYSFISEEIPALKDVWIVGDGFIYDTFSTFQSAKIEARIDKTKPPYLHDYYNVKFLMYPPLSNVKSTEARFVNSLIEGLNEKLTLPKYIIIILEKDFLEGVLPRLYDHGLKTIMREGMEWIMKTMSRILDSRKEQLRSRRPGTLSTSAEPRLIWAMSLQRPHNLHDSVRSTFKLVSKSNETLEEMIRRYSRYNHIMYIDNIDECRFFDNVGKLMEASKSAYWREVDAIMRKFDRGEIELDPKPEIPKGSKNQERKSMAVKQRGHHHDDYVQSSRNQYQRSNSQPYGFSRSGKKFYNNKGLSLYR